MSARFSGEETIDGGYDAGFIIKAINDLERFNIYEASISGGNYEQAEKIAPPYWYKHGYYADVARRIRGKVKVPISTVGRITTPQCAEEIIARGDADLVYLGRELVAFPFFAEASEKGLPIKECLGCGCCFDSMARGEGLRCAINPFVGQDAAILESEVNKRSRKNAAKRVAVIGGGPAGLTAATEAAKQGHEVKLYERDRVVGGKLNLAGSVSERKGEMLRLVKYLEDEARAAGAEIIHDQRITDVSQLGDPDLVIVATGGAERRIEIEGLKKWVSAEEAIRNPNSLGERVIIAGVEWIAPSWLKPWPNSVKMCRLSKFSGMY